MATNKSVLLVGSCAALDGNGEGPLAREGVSVRGARTVAQALAQHRTEPASVIVTDLDLPDGTAEDLCAAVRRDDALRRVALLVLCGDSEDERRRAAECNANAQAIHPRDPAELAARVLPLLSISSRAIYHVLARVTADSPSGSRSFFCTSRNVSASGILVETDEALRPGQMLECSFFLPGRQRVETRCRVVREAAGKAGRQFGLQFVDVPADATAALEDLVGRWRTR